MQIPVPTWAYLLWMLFVSLFLVGTRLLTVFTPLYLIETRLSDKFVAGGEFVPDQ